jgi:hypothetical protein
MFFSKKAATMCRQGEGKGALLITTVGPVADERHSDRPIQGLQYCSLEGCVFIRAGVAGCRDGGRVRGRTIIIGTRQIAALAHSLLEEFDLPSP